MTALLHKFRQLFLSPGSKLELWLRTKYHKTMKTRLAFWLQDLTARISYRRWRDLQLKTPLQDLPIGKHPLVSFILPYKPSRLEQISDTINSIQNLPVKRWDIYVDTDEPDFPPGIKNSEEIKQIDLKKDDLQNVIAGEYVVFCQPGDIFYEGFLYHFYQHYNDDPDSSVFYYDCEYFAFESKRWIPIFKPQIPSPALLLSTNIFSRSIINVAEVNKIWPFLETGQDFEAREYEISLRLYEYSVKFKHISELLASQFSPVTSQSPGNTQAISKHLSRQGLQEVSVDKSFELPRFTWQTGDPSVAIIIPTRNNRYLLEPLINSIARTTQNSRVSINLVDNQTTDLYSLDYYSELEQKKKFNLIHYDQPFNYSEAINIGVAQSDSDLILLMNDDMLVRNNIWLTELIQWAIRPDIGVVGAKLFRANHTIQHAGIILGLSGFVGHLYLNAPEAYHGLMGSVDWYRNFMAVTGALQMMRREVFEEVGGYDTGFQLAFGDIDFCLRVHNAGYQNVYTPFSQLYHYEGHSRGYDTPVNDILKGYEDFHDFLIEGDPYFSPSLTTSRIPKCVNKKFSQQDRIEQIEARKRFYL